MQEPPPAAACRRTETAIGASPFTSPARREERGREARDLPVTRRGTTGREQRHRRQGSDTACRDMSVVSAEMLATAVPSCCREQGVDVDKFASFEGAEGRCRERALYSPALRRRTSGAVLRKTAALPYLSPASVVIPHLRP